MKTKSNFQVAREKFLEYANGVTELQHEREKSHTAWMDYKRLIKRTHWNAKFTESDQNLLNIAPNDFIRRITSLENRIAIGQAKVKFYARVVAVDGRPDPTALELKKDVVLLVNALNKK